MHECKGWAVDDFMGAEFSLVIIRVFETNRCSTL